MLQCNVYCSTAAANCHELFVNFTKIHRQKRKRSAGGGIHGASGALYKERRGRRKRSVGDAAPYFLGALNREGPLRAGRCFCWGCAVLLRIAGNAVQRATGYGVSLVAWTTGVIMPTHFVLAAGWFFLKPKPVREEAKRL